MSRSPAVAKQSFTRSTASLSDSGVAELCDGNTSGETVLSWLSSTGMIRLCPEPWHE